MAEQLCQDDVALHKKYQLQFSYNNTQLLNKRLASLFLLTNDNSGVVATVIDRINRIIVVIEKKEGILN